MIKRWADGMLKHVTARCYSLVHLQNMRDQEHDRNHDEREHNGGDDNANPTYAGRRVRSSLGRYCRLCLWIEFACTLAAVRSVWRVLCTTSLTSNHIFLPNSGYTSIAGGSSLRWLWTE